MRVIGTAGHVDHGKSTLVKRLTGIDPDRLAEEQARQMTIDLGFAWLTLPNGESVGVVDVPGHRDFIENMLAGVGGLDAVLLVIAADEGLMPQTREHLAIIDLLDIRSGIVVLSKADLVDAEWLALIEHEVRAALRPTTLAAAPILPVSALSGAGIPELLRTLSTLLDSLPYRADSGHPRLPIDRVFTIKGFGTVLTGTLLGGALRLGDEVELQPGGLRGRVRGLQSHKQQVEIIRPGSRAAVNVAGIERDQAARGQVLTHPGQLTPTTLIDVSFRHLPDADHPLKHNTEIKFFSATAESLGYVRLLDSQALAPGAHAWLQIRLNRPLALNAGDHFVLRLPSPARTIGGGLIVNAHPGKRWRRFNDAVLNQLKTRLSGTPAQRVAQAAAEPSTRRALLMQTGLAPAELDAALSEALAQNLLSTLPDGSYWAEAQRQDVLQRLLRELSAYHAANPLRPGMAREELRSRFRLKPAVFNLLLETQNEIAAAGSTLRLSAFRIQFTPAQQAQIARLMTQMNSYTPPSFAEAAALVGEDVLRALIELGDVVQVQEDVIFAPGIYQQMLDAVYSLIDSEGAVTVKALRDRFDTSRKYAIGLLEYLDAQGITKRVGDARVRGRHATT
ncbi:MAG: selenocysteine-specific translation elongation factor [Chloroflexi bacterium]|nr:selenocysteine-specific translation elongation factor [Chloroflexota bacterium]